jgi:hypothetical protein
VRALLLGFLLLGAAQAAEAPRDANSVVLGDDSTDCDCPLPTATPTPSPSPSPTFEPSLTPTETPDPALEAIRNLGFAAAWESQWE